MLTGEEIKEQRRVFNIVIERFNEENLQPNSYDFTIGKYVARYKYTYDYNKEDYPLVDIATNDISTLYNIMECAKIIHILPGERILCHTDEFFGTIRGSVACLATRSTIARLGMDICGSAGFGDLGYVNRWTLELQNNSPYEYAIPVGTRVGQVYFQEIKNYLGQPKYKGDYNLEHNFNINYEELLEKWQPEMMLPKVGRA